jgi:F0F1-type ATP synthase assembly protein I
MTGRRAAARLSPPDPGTTTRDDDRGHACLSTKPPGPDNLGSAMSKGMSQASYGLSAAFAFVFVVISLWLVGRWIDGLLDIEPWAQVVGAVLGWIAGVFVVYIAAQRGFE